MKKIKKNDPIIKLMIFAVLLIILTVIILNAMARYESEGQTIGEIMVALYVIEPDFQTMDLKLDTMIPRNDPYIYNFSISNYRDDRRTDVEIEYDLVIRTTTNLLPLRYELYVNQVHNAPGAVNVIQGEKIEQDSHGTYFKSFMAGTKVFGHETNETNLYQLLIYFPDTTANRAAIYQDIIESVEINIHSRQVLEDD